MLKKKISFPGGGNCPPCPPAMYSPVFERVIGIHKEKMG